MNSIYSAESIALSRRRANAIRAQVERGELDETWIETADELDASAAEREALASTGSTMNECPNCGAAIVQTRAIPTAADPLAITETCSARCGWHARRSMYTVPVDPASLVDCEGCQ